MQCNGQGGLALRALPMPARFGHTRILEATFIAWRSPTDLAHDPPNLGDFIPHGHLPPVVRRRDEEDRWSDRYAAPIKSESGA